MAELPVPPLEMREAVGPTDPAMFDNPTGDPIFPWLDPRAYDSVLDFGCGCGRLARQLIQQRDRPSSYLGIDLHKPLIDWCTANLSPSAPGFEFLHHDVRYPTWNEGADKPDIAPFPVADSSRSLIIAYSVFTHVVQAHAEYYLDEVARALSPEGALVSTWFLFEKKYFPMMQEFQNALYINEVSPTNAVIFDREWVVAEAAKRGLVIAAAQLPLVRGFQWTLTMMRTESGAEAVELPTDDAPISTDGSVRAAAIQPDLNDA